MTKIDYHKTRGIRKHCTLNDLKYFHITTNISVDILHYLYEGAMPFVLKHLFIFMINSKILTKNEIIQMIQFFDYGEINVRNIPSIVALEKVTLAKMAHNRNACSCTYHLFSQSFNMMRE